MRECDKYGSNVKVGDIISYLQFNKNKNKNKEYGKVIRIDYDDKQCRFWCESWDTDIEIVKKGIGKPESATYLNSDEAELFVEPPEPEPIPDPNRCDKGHLLYVEGEPTAINDKGICTVCCKGKVYCGGN
jgi:formylmethanofuran dehydrogenase subunit E